MRVDDFVFSGRLLLQTALFDYKDWTRVYVSFEKREDGIWYKCLTINAKYLTCYSQAESGSADILKEMDSPSDYLPADFVESIEVHTEMLLGPIEVTSQKEPDSVLQQKFYKRKGDALVVWPCMHAQTKATPAHIHIPSPSCRPLTISLLWPLLTLLLVLLSFLSGPRSAELEKIEGPRSTERDRVKVFNSITTKEVSNYDEKLALVAPPLMFQRRLLVSSCNQAVAKPFLKAQFDLVNVSHCPKDGMCPGMTKADDVMQCVGKEESSVAFYGLSTKELNSEKGFADFLFTYSVSASSPTSPSCPRLDQLPTQLETRCIYNPFL